MWTLPLPEIADVDAQLTTALTLVNGQAVYTLSAIERAAVHEVYAAYDNNLGQPHPTLQPPTLAACRTAIAEGYNQVQIGGRLASLRSRLLLSASTCPYCGFGELTDLDHFLPRAVYGELAIYPRNLIPSCGKCNNAKRTIIPGVGPGAGLIHSYFQQLPDVEFMRADIIFSDASLDVSFRIDGTHLPPDIVAKLEYQLERLKLNERYPKQVNKFLAEQRTAIMSFKELGLTAEQLSAYFLRSATSLTGNFGLNDWRPALLRALAADDGFCSEPERYLGERMAADAAVQAP